MFSRLYVLIKLMLSLPADAVP